MSATLNMNDLNHQRQILELALHNAVKMVSELMYLRDILEPHRPLTDDAIQNIDHHISEITSLITSSEDTLAHHIESPNAKKTGCQRE